MAESLKPPGNFFLTHTESLSDPSETARNWSAWLQQFHLYMTTTEKNKKNEEVQVATLLRILGSQGQELFRTFDISQENQKKISEVIAAFTEYFTPRVKEEFERYKFYSRTQKPGESFDCFFNTIQSLISTCNFHVQERDKALRDRIVIGISAETVREELLNVDGELDLSRAVQICRRAQATKSYMDQMSKQEEINALSKQYISTAQRKNNRTIASGATNMLVKDCKYCGRSHGRRQCPAYGKTCSSCGRKNHFQAVCMSTDRSKQSIAVAAEEDNSIEAITERNIGPEHEGDLCFTLSD